MVEVIIPVSREHVKQLQLSINFIFNNLFVEKIKIISKKELFSYFPVNMKIDFIDEDTSFSFNYHTIENILRQRGGDIKRSGWYFQQFLKMEYCFISKKDYYLIWDADTIPLSKINFFTEDGKKMLFNKKEEHHIPYFKTMDVLFNKKMEYQTKSFISEGMIIECKIMKEMIMDINNNRKLKGKNWIEKIMYAISFDDLNYSGFSEFETYGNYLINKYPYKYQERTLKTLRNGMSRYGRLLTPKELMMLDIDTISFENWDKPQNFFLKLESYMYILQLYLRKVINQ